MIDSDLTQIKGVGPELAKKFSQLGVKNYYDLIINIPKRYEDYSTVSRVHDLRPGKVTIKASIKQVSGRYVRRGMHITEAIASDDTDSVRLVWFNQPYRANAIKKNSEYYISGEFALRRQRFSIQNPSMELTSNFPVNTARIIPIYREVRGLKSQQIRKTIKNCIDYIHALSETLPDWIISENKLINYSQAIEMMHFPANHKKLEAAKKRLGFEEVFELTLAALLNKYELLQEKSIKILFDEKLAKQFVENLPFKLTDAQRKAIWQIFLDMEKNQPMNRLLEGDVGSGKTVVAAMASAMAMNQDFQVAFMAPTEILANQHTETLYDLLAPLGLSDKIGVLVGGMKTAEKSSMKLKIKNGEAKLIVGTHALFQESIDMHNLGLIIVDEQHRFGVEQRKMLQKKAGHMPHVLNMTATPIPRSLALTLYGEMDITIIDAKPIGRKPIVTEIVSPNSRKQLYEKISFELLAGRQMFIVAAMIKENNNFSAVSAEEVYEKAKKDFKEYRIGMLHGKMKPDEKERSMQQFMRHEIDILVSTTVIEVGVNVPNATVMLIENAERFGLAQIHQLRGRVGRSEHQGYCYLMMGDSSAPSRRLQALEQTENGFKLAEYDLELRGPGAIYGTMQHGQLDLRVAKLSDTKLIASARKAAQEFIDRGENLLKYKQLNNRVREIRAITNLN